MRRCVSVFWEGLIPVPLTHEIYGFSFSNQFKLALIKSNSLFSVKHLNFDLNPQDGNRFKPLNRGWISSIVAFRMKLDKATR